MKPKDDFENVRRFFRYLLMFAIVLAVLAMIRGRASFDEIIITVIGIAFAVGIFYYQNGGKI